MSKSLIHATATLLGGAGIGAALMYLFDPETGARRRAAVGDSASHAVDATRETLGAAGDAAADTWHDLSEHVGDLSKTLAKKARRYGAKAREGSSAVVSHLKSHAHDSASAASDFVADTASQARGYGHRLFGRARDAGSHYASQARSAVGYPEEHHGLSTAAGVTIASFTALALGAGLMYLMDPAQGEHRRSVIRDKAGEFGGHAGDYLRAGGRYAADLASQAGAKVGLGTITDESLTSKVRDQLGHLIPGHSVNVSVGQGRVRLSGYIGASQLESLLSAVRGIRGVTGVDNELEVRDIVSPSQRNG